jgi:peptide/nickel transport system substrate-binding protein
MGHEVRPRLVILATLVVAMIATGCQAPTGGGRPSGSGQDAAPAAKVFRRVNAAIQSEPTVLSRKIRLLGVGIAGVAELETLVAAGLTVADDRGQPQAQLAEQVPTIENGLWKLLPDGRMETTWVIRQSAIWHDGTPVTPADLLFTTQVAQDREIGAFRESAYDMIEGVETDGDRSVTVRWKQPYIEADNLFSPERVPPMPRHLLEKTFLEDKASFTQVSYWNEGFVGTGPFRVARWTAGTGVTLQAFDGFALGRPRIDEIDVKFIPNPASLAAATLAGTVDLTIGRTLSLEQSLDVRDRWSAGRIETDNFQSTLLIYPQFIDPSPAVIGDVRFRRAMLQALDRQEMAETFQAGLAPMAHAYLVPTNAEYPAIQDQIVRYPFDPRLANDAITGLGFAKSSDGMFRDGSGAPLVVEIRTSQGDDLQEKALFGSAGHWQRAGVQVTQVLVPPQLAQGREYRATFPAFDVKRQPGERGFLERVHGSKTPLPETDWVGNNYNRYMNRDFDALVDRYFATIGFAERTRVLGQIVRHMTDQVLYLTLFYQTSPVLVGTHLRNVTATAQGWNAHAWDWVD